MTRASRILLVTTSLALGGAERQVVDLAVGLRRRGREVAVVSMIPPTAHVEELSAAGVRLLGLGMRRGRPSPAGLVRYVRTARAWRPDVVHGHMVHANLLTRLGRLFLRRPVISTVHNVIEGGRWREIAYRLTDPLAAATTTISDTATARYAAVGAVPAGRLMTVPNGVRLDRIAPPDGARERVRSELGVGSGFLWLTVGRLVPEKGHAALLEAFATVRDRHPAARLALAGTGPERSTLESLAADHGLRDAVELLGPRSDVPSLLAAADAFVLSSRWEGLPIVLLEAAAAGLPIVTTDVGGCREVARPELGAVLTGRRPADIARGMEALMALDPAERTAVGERLREHVVASYDMERVLDRWEGLYDSVVRAGRRAAGADVRVRVRPDAGPE